MLEDRNYIYDENILDGNDPLGSRIILEEEKFNLNDFLHSKGISSGAIVLITRKQMIITDTFVKVKDSNYGSHIDAAVFIYEAIYKEKPLITYTEDRNILINWQKEIMLDGNILVQLCDPKYDLSLIWIPDMISDDQLKMFKVFSNKVRSVINDDIQYFTENPVGFAIMHGNQYEEIYNDIDGFVNNLMINKKRR